MSHPSLKLYHQAALLKNIINGKYNTDHKLRVTIATHIAPILSSLDPSIPPYIFLLSPILPTPTTKEMGLAS